MDRSREIQSPPADYNNTAYPAPDRSTQQAVPSQEPQTISWTASNTANGRSVEGRHSRAPSLTMGELSGQVGDVKLSGPSYTTKQTAQAAGPAAAPTDPSGGGSIPNERRPEFHPPLLIPQGSQLPSFKTLVSAVDTLDKNPLPLIPFNDGELPSFLFRLQARLGKMLYFSKYLAYDTANMYSELKLMHRSSRSFEFFAY